MTRLAVSLIGSPRMYARSPLMFRNAWIALVCLVGACLLYTPSYDRAGGGRGEQAEAALLIQGATAGRTERGSLAKGGIADRQDVDCAAPGSFVDQDEAVLAYPGKALFFLPGYRGETFALELERGQERLVLDTLLAGVATRGRPFARAPPLSFL